MDLQAIFDAYSAHHVDLEELHPVVRHYIASRQAGTSHKLAEMFALQASPEIRGTDSILWKGWDNDQFKSGDGRMAQELDRRYREQAIKAGVSLTGKRYSHALARWQGDPQAWVSDQHDMLRLAREQNVHMDGVVSHKPVQMDPADSAKLVKANEQPG